MTTTLRTILGTPLATAPDPVRPAPSRARRLVRGRPGDPAWVRPGLLALLVATAALFLWDLGASGNSNEFYAAAVQAGSESWKAWFFGSLDAAGSITVDKPPAALWVMGLSARVFGYSSWSLLVPQALEGVAAVALLYGAVRRVAGPAAGLAAGALLALTPAAVLAFKFDNPDALLLLLAVAATYCVTRALEAARTRWMVLAGVAIGLGFLTKSGQALLVLPALGLAYLLFAPTSVRRRLVQLVLGLVAIVVSAGWWLLVVAVWPAADRPYIGGSTDNSPLELAFGYNGLGRLFGGSGNGGGGGGFGGSGNTSFGGATGPLRMFHGEFALEISWLLPAALVALVALGWLTWRTSRVSRLRSAVVVWGGSLLVTAGVFSFMQGTIHPYYSVALAPSVAALVAVGVQQLWARRGVAAHAVLGVMLVVSAGWGLVLLHRNDQPLVVEVALLTLTLLGMVGLLARAIERLAGRRLVSGLALAAVLAVGLPTASWAAQTTATPHQGSVPTAVTSSASGGRGMGMGGGSSNTSSALTAALQKTTTRWSAATVGAQTASSLELSSDTSVMAIGGFTGSDSSPTLAQFQAYVAAGKIHYFVVGGGGGGFARPSGASGGSSTAPSGSRPSGQRPSGVPGGAGQGGAGQGGAGQGGSGTSSSITTWVEAHFTKTTVGGQTVYDLTSPTS